MGLMTNIALLKPDFREKVKLMLKEFDDLGFKYIINETLRSVDVQRAYYAQGREPLVRVNRLRNVAGLWEITEEENKKQVTWTMASKHILGLAIDIVPVNPKTGKAWWTAPQTIWDVIGTVAKKYGLKWGGDWKNPDSPHIEATI